MNTAQAALYHEMHNQNVILKARQRGFTTFVQLLLLDACVFNSDVRAGPARNPEVPGSPNWQRQSNRRSPSRIRPFRKF
jgi:hypothetical protein